MGIAQGGPVFCDVTFLPVFQLVVWWVWRRVWCQLACVLGCDISPCLSAGGVVGMAQGGPVFCDVTFLPVFQLVVWWVWRKVGLCSVM